MHLRLLIALATVSAMASCASPPGGFDSPVPAERLKAATVAAEEQDQQSVPDLIRLLESDDPLVRMTAIRSLERITGHTHGYHYADPEVDRRKAIKTWVEWQKQSAKADSNAGAS